MHMQKWPVVKKKDIKQSKECKYPLRWNWIMKAKSLKKLLVIKEICSWLTPGLNGLNVCSQEHRSTDSIQCIFMAQTQHSSNMAWTPKLTNWETYTYMYNMYIKSFHITSKAGQLADSQLTRSRRRGISQTSYNWLQLYYLFTYKFYAFGSENEATLICRLYEKFKTWF